MLFRTLNELQFDPAVAIARLLMFVGALVAAITVHEFSHALVATRLGDPTPRSMGRLTLRPLPHLDPVGSVMILVAGFGWGKPVIVNPVNLKTGIRAGLASVSLAGPASNFIMATVAAVIIRVLDLPPADIAVALFPFHLEAFLGSVLVTLVLLNLILGVFNLIPIAPLDGFKVALGILPKEAAASYARTERYGPIILLGVILLDIIIPGLGILSTVLGPIIGGLLGLLVG